MQEQNATSLLTKLMEEIANLRQQLAQQQTRINQLESRELSSGAASTEPQAKMPTSRRKMLQKLAAGTITAVGLTATASVIKPQDAKADVFQNPNSQVGAIILPPGFSFAGAPPVVSTYYGLVASSSSSFDLSVLPTNNTGIFGHSVSFNGVHGKSSSVGGGFAGVYGENTSTGTAIYGTSAGGVGIWGEGSSYGVYGISSSHAGVKGLSGSAPGISGVSSTGEGVHGTSTSGRGVWAESSSGEGVYGTSANNRGVSGNSTNSVGVYGYSAHSFGVYGEANNSAGVAAYSLSGIGIYSSSTNGVPLHLEPGTPTASHSVSKGDIYVSTTGNGKLFMYTDNGWKSISFS